MKIKFARRTWLALTALVTATVGQTQAYAQSSAPAPVTAAAPMTANVQTPSPEARHYSAQELQGLHRAALRRGASLEDKKNFQRAVYAPADWNDQTIDGRIGSDTRLHYARSMARMGGHQNLSFADTMLLAQDSARNGTLNRDGSAADRAVYQPQFDNASSQGSCASNSTSFLGGVCFHGVRSVSVRSWPGAREMFGRHYHMGADVGVSYVPFSAPRDAIVIGAGPAGGFGQYVAYAMRTANENEVCAVLVGHVSRINVTQGQRVPAGQILGVTGNEGDSTGPHAHVEVACTTNGGASVTGPNLRELQSQGGLGVRQRFILASSQGQGRVPAMLGRLMRQHAASATAALTPQPAAPAQVQVAAAAPVNQVAETAPIQGRSLQGAFQRQAAAEQNGRALNFAPRTSLDGSRVSMIENGSQSIRARQEDVGNVFPQQRYKF